MSARQNNETDPAVCDVYGNTKKFKFESYQFSKNCCAPHKLAKWKRHETAGSRFKET